MALLHFSAIAFTAGHRSSAGSNVAKRRFQLPQLAVHRRVQFAAPCEVMSVELSLFRHWQVDNSHVVWQLQVRWIRRRPASVESHLCVPAMTRTVAFQDMAVTWEAGAGELAAAIKVI